MDIKQLYSGAEKEAFYPKVKLDSIEDKVNGKTLEQNLQDYNTKIQNLNKQVFGTTSGASNNTSAIDTVPEVYSFLNGYANSTTLQAVINAIPKGGTTIIEQGSVVSVSGLQSSGTSLGTITVDNSNYQIKLPSNIIQNAVDYSNLSLSLSYDPDTHMLSLYKNGHLEKSIELPIDNQDYTVKPASPTMFNAVYNNASGYNNVAINLSWDVVSGCDGYIIYRKANDGVFGPITNTIGPDTLNHYVDEEIVVGGRYTYYIVSILNGQESDPQYSAPVQTQLRVDSPVLNDVQFDSDNNRVEVTWGLLDEITSYKVYRNGSLIYTVPGNNTSVYYDTTVAENATYTYYVTALIGTTESNPSQSVSVTTTPTNAVSINSIGFVGELITSGEYYIMASIDNDEYVAEAILPNTVPVNTTVVFTFNGIQKTGTAIATQGSSTYRSTATFSASDFVSDFADLTNPSTSTPLNKLEVKAMYLGKSATASKSYYIQYPMYHGFTDKTYFVKQDASSWTVDNQVVGERTIYGRTFTSPLSSSQVESRYFIGIAAKLGNPSGLINAGSLPTRVQLYPFSSHDRYNTTIGGIEYNFFMTESTFIPANLTGNDRIKVKFVFD